jgi:hypothetical protein
MTIEALVEEFHSESVTPDALSLTSGEIVEGCGLPSWHEPIGEMEDPITGETTIDKSTMAAMSRQGQLTPKFGTAVAMLKEIATIDEIAAVLKSEEEQLYAYCRQVRVTEAELEVYTRQIKYRAYRRIGMIYRKARHGARGYGNTGTTIRNNHIFEIQRFLAEGKLTQREIADKVCVSQTIVRDVGSGKLQVSEVDRTKGEIADQFGLTTSEAKAAAKYVSEMEEDAYEKMMEHPPAETELMKAEREKNRTAKRTDNYTAEERDAIEETMQEYEADRAERAAGSSAAREKATALADELAEDETYDGNVVSINKGDRAKVQAGRKKRDPKPKKSPAELFETQFESALKEMAEAEEIERMEAAADRAKKYVALHVPAQPLEGKEANAKAKELLDGVSNGLTTVMRSENELQELLSNSSDTWTNMLSRKLEEAEKQMTRLRSVLERVKMAKAGEHQCAKSTVN